MLASSHTYMSGTMSAAPKNQPLDDCCADGAPSNLAFSLEIEKNLVSVQCVFVFFEKVAGE
jgi:hypothetical protein